MPIPGFTAEASVGSTTQVYRVGNHYGVGIVSGLYPQWNDGNMDVGWAEGFGDEAAMEMAEDVEADWEEGLSDEVAIEMAEDVEADWEEGLGDEAAMGLTDVEADNDLESDVSTGV